MVKNTANLPTISAVPSAKAWSTIVVNGEIERHFSEDRARWPIGL